MNRTSGNQAIIKLATLGLVLIACAISLALGLSILAPVFGPVGEWF